MEQAKQSPLGVRPKIWIVGALLVLGVWLSTMPLLWCFYSGNATSSDNAFAVRGQLGDAFGAANALFSGFAMLGVAVALFLQVQENASAHEDARKRDAQAERQRMATLLGGAAATAQAICALRFEASRNDRDGAHRTQAGELLKQVEELHERVRQQLASTSG